MDSATRPVLWLLVGVNGAGKTTFYEQRLARTALAFVNADVIARATWGREDEGSHGYDAMQLAETRRSELIAARRSFVAETVFSHPSKLDLIREARVAGYLVYVVFINVVSTELAVSRVRQRHARGGHDVPEAKIRERHSRTLANVRATLPLADRLFVFDNSAVAHPHRHLLTFAEGRLSHVGDPLPDWARTLFAPELKAHALSRRNPQARAFEAARRLARELLGPTTKVYFARTGQQVYVGRVIGETESNVLQSIGEERVVAHAKARLDRAPRPGARVFIEYVDGRASVRSRARSESTGRRPRK